MGLAENIVMEAQVAVVVVAEVEDLQDKRYCMLSKDTAVVGK